MLLGLIAFTPEFASAAEVTGLRPLGGDFESARSIKSGQSLLELGGWMPRFTGDGVAAGQEDIDVLQRWQEIPAWPDMRLLHGLADGNAVVVRAGSAINGGYRKPFLRAEAPWGEEYLQAWMQAGVGFHLASRRPMVYASLPGIYERGAFTLHVAGGGYYLFNDQPLVEGSLGCEVRPFDWLDLGATARLRMDSKKMTPTDGSWSYGGGLRIRPAPNWGIQLEAGRDVGPPEPAGGTPARPRIEFPLESLRAGISVLF
ncbi:MAG: hypothetical protein VKP62_09150 [Candidatus Sericytochromatia bacterium]|nr:hypothetical protein [Candidatus Sericytochromatia bacterium]